MDSSVSKLHLYSLGVVAANKPLDSKDIEVTPIEDAPLLDGEITDNLEQYASKGTTPLGEHYEATVQSTVSVKATWLPFGSNRMTAPDVRRGETVVLYRFGDVDKYYWTTLQQDMRLRKLETVVFAFSNTRDEAVTADAKTSYYFEVSTHRKLIHLHTSNSDGEPFVYDIQLNTKDGSLIIQDDIGNYFSFDSKNVRLEMRNADGSHLDMDRKVISMTAPETINLKAGKQINLEAGDSINHKTSTINTSADETNNDVPITNFDGNTKTTGTASMKSFSSGAGGGSFSVSGDGEFTGTVNVNKLVSSQDIDAPNV